MPLSSRRAGHRPLSPADLKQVEAQRVEVNCPRSQQQARTRSPPSCLTAFLLSHSVHASSPGQATNHHRQDPGFKPKQQSYGEGISGTGQQTGAEERTREPSQDGQDHSSTVNMTDAGPGLVRFTVRWLCGWTHC
ncbi:hypothetical protein CapIbe_021901 [Capra ibex]